MSHPSTLKLHQYRYGELDAAASAELRAHVDACASCSERLRAQEAQRAEFVALPVPDAIRELEAAPVPWWRRLRWALVAGALIPAAAAALLLARPLLTGPVAPEIADTRTKGEAPALEVWVEGPEGLRVIGEGERLGAGDRVQPYFDPRGSPFVTFAGSDGGDVEVYRTVAVENPGLQPAPFGLTLDDAPGPQWLYAIGSDAPLDVEAVRQAIGSNEAPSQTYRVRIDKE